MTTTCLYACSLQAVMQVYFAIAISHPHKIWSTFNLTVNVIKYLHHQLMTLSINANILIKNIVVTKSFLGVAITYSKNIFVRSGSDMAPWHLAQWHLTQLHSAEQHSAQRQPAKNILHNDTECWMVLCWASFILKVAFLLLYKMVFGWVSLCWVAWHHWFGQILTVIEC